MAPALQPSAARTGGRLLGAVAVPLAVAGAAVLLFPALLADAFFARWVLFAVLLAVAGGVGAWTARTPLVWTAALLLTALSVLGMWSLGPFVAPAALALLGSAVLSHLASSSRTDRDRTAPDPPPVREAVLWVGAGVGSVAVGGWLVYLGAIARELFGACAREMPACVLARTHWDAVGTTLVGLLTIALGGWLLRRLGRRIARSRRLAPGEVG